MSGQRAWPEPVAVHAVRDDDGGTPKLLAQNGLHSLGDSSDCHRQLHDHVEQLILLLVVVQHLAQSQSEIP